MKPFSSCMSLCVSTSHGHLLLVTALFLPQLCSVGCWWHSSQTKWHSVSCLWLSAFLPRATPSWHDQEHRLKHIKSCVVLNLLPLQYPWLWGTLSSKNRQQEEGSTLYLNTKIAATLLSFQRLVFSLPSTDKCRAKGRMCSNSKQSWAASWKATLPWMQMGSNFGRRERRDKILIPLLAPEIRLKNSAVL